MGDGYVMWPMTACGETRVLPCFDGAESGSLSRQCSAEGQWSEVTSNCACSAKTEFGTMWPRTPAEETAHVACGNNPAMTRDRHCMTNGEWESTTTGGCECVEQEYLGIRWAATTGGQTAEHLCDLGAEGEAYRRACGVDGTWSEQVEGGCRCTARTDSGVEWTAAEALHTQVEQCSASSAGTQMTRTCSRFGTWQNIQGNCDCPEQLVDDLLWPQTTSGQEARVGCVAGAVGTPSKRQCKPLGEWEEPELGACACPSQDWSNYAGTHYVFPETAEGETVSLPCVHDPAANITRTCGALGAWEEPEGCFEEVYCPAEQKGPLSFERTLGGSTVMIMCNGDSNMSYGRVCKENGEWEDVIGYCQCEATVDAMGTQWPRLRSERTLEQDCVAGYSGRISRGCSFFGEWTELSNTCTRNVCAEETLNGITWAATDSLTTATQMCADGVSSLTRVCSAEGTWEAVEGSCLCPQTVLSGVELAASPLGTMVERACENDLVGSKRFTCGGLGSWEVEDQCHPISCSQETYLNVEWPQTEAGRTASVACSSSAPGNNTRYCRSTGEWSSVVGGEGCYCDETTVEEKGLYVFAQTESEQRVEKACSSLYTGTISYYCSRSGLWTDLDNQCQRIQCPSSQINGLAFPATDSATTYHIACSAGSVGAGYDRYCMENGQWEDEVTGACSCPEETLRHVDGHMYSFPETSAGDVVSQLCGGDLAGSVSRVCGMTGAWQNIRGECKHLECPEETIDGFVWPRSNSSTEVRLPCRDYQTGFMSRTCHAAGVWGDPVNNCTEHRCEPLSVKRLANGCMNIMFDLDRNEPYVRVNVVPSNSPDMSIVVRGSTARICGMEANIPYSMFVQYCDDSEKTSCRDLCMMDNVYYQQVCDVMQPVDVVDVERGTELNTVSFSSKFPRCPETPHMLEIAYKCVEGCADDSEFSRTTVCTELDGCKAGSRHTVSIEDFPLDAVFEVRQRMHLVNQFSDLQPYSEPRTFRVRDLLQTATIEPKVEFLNSHKVRLDLSATGVTAYRKHVIYVYKKLTGSRRLVDSLFSTVTLCPLGTGVCEDTTTDVVVEPGYDYSFSVYSYPTVTGGKVTVSTKHVSVEPTPSFTMTAVGGDSFITVTLADAKYPLSGACSFAVRDVFSFEQRMVYVTLPKGERKTVVASNLDMDTPYTVTCVLRDEMDMEGSKTIENVKTLPFVDPELELRKVADTAYDVQVEAVVNKPCELYCTVSPAGREWSLQELLTSGEQFSVTDSSAPFLVNLLLAQEPVEEYYVWCAAVVLSDHGVVRSVAITPSGLPFAPELIRTVPVNGATDVSARVNMELVFKYPVQVQSCQFCFFILYDTKERKSINLYASAFSVQQNRIVFNSVQLNSETTYQLRTSTRGMIVDASNSVPFEPKGDMLLTFTSKKYLPIDGDVIIDGDFLEVNGVIRVMFNSYLFLNEGAITLNALSIDASNMCLQITHPSADETVLFIPVADCVGLLRPDASYVLVMPEGVLFTRDRVLSPRLTHLFHTADKSYAPKVINSYPVHMDSYVPLDTPVKLYFDQPVTAGAGFVFISEYLEGEYVNSYNIPGSKAVFSQSYPYEASWEGHLFTLKPHHTYVISWSEDVVRNAYDQPAAASTASETIEFQSAKSACSADFLAENSYGVFQCTYEDEKCVCRQWNMVAMTN